MIKIKNEIVNSDGKSLGGRIIFECEKTAILLNEKDTLIMIKKDKKTSIN